MQLRKGEKNRFIEYLYKCKPHNNTGGNITLIHTGEKLRPNVRELAKDLAWIQRSAQAGLLTAPCGIFDFVTTLLYCLNIHH